MKRVSSVLLLMAAIAGSALGCGGAATGSPEGAGVAGLPSDFTGPGVYTVPAVPSAQFSISSVRIEQEDGEVSLYYDLPADLVGQKVRVDLDGAPDGATTIDLAGAMGTSTCTVSPGELICHEHLSGLHVDPGSDELPPDGPERTAAQSFITDPIGLLRVTLPM